MWLLGFFLHEMAFGLLSIFVPLYVTSSFVGGSLVDVGLMVSLATFVAIPFSYFWGYACDRTGRYKPFILLSFSVLSILLYLFSSTTNIIMLTAIYALVAVFHVAHETPKNVLIAEWHSREEWEKSFASYEMLTESGVLIGLVLGFVTSLYGFSGSLILLICSALNIIAFVSSTVFVVDPPVILERGLAGMERTLSYAQRGITMMLRNPEGQAITERLKSENATAYYVGLTLFSLASATFFTPIPVFFSQKLGLASTVVFAIFVLNAAGGCSGYYYVRRKAQTELSGEKHTVTNIALIRSLLAFSLITPIVYLSTLTTGLAVAMLVLMGVAYSVFFIGTLSISMEVLPQGKAGVFNVLIGVGGAIGCFIGPLIAQTFGDPYGFLYVFVVASAIFFLSFLAFRIFARD
jgi:MFS family permease